MMKFDKTYITLYLILALSSCTKESVDEYIVTTEKPMLFGVEQIAQTRVNYTDQTDGKMSATFSIGDEIGMYAYYNNYYYFYTDYDNFAESVVFANHGMHIDANQDLTYEPLHSWTFSTLYGTAPYMLDCVAFYPFDGTHDYNPKYINMVHDEGGAATLEYYYYGYLGYVDESKEEATYIVNSNIDFMTAHTRFDGTTDTNGNVTHYTPAEFRTVMLDLDNIPLKFTRQMACINLQVTKPDGDSSVIEVTGITIHFDAPTKFTQTFGANAKAEWDITTMTKGSFLEASTTCSQTLKETSWVGTPTEGATYIKEKLLKHDEILFIPPGTDLQKVVFTLTENSSEKTYTWHPHVEITESNTLYVLNLELDPDRAN